MDDLISRAYVLAEYDRQHQGPPGGARKIMEEAPAVDAVPVVRCKDCKNFKMGYLNYDGMCLCSGDFMDNDDYCSLGERRDGDA